MRHMKKLFAAGNTKRGLCLYICVLLTLAALVGCSSADPKPAETAAPGSTAGSGSETSIQPGTETPGTGTQPPPTATETGHPPLTAEQKGKPLPDDMDGVEILFSDDFESGKWDNGGAAIARDDKVRVIDGVLNMPVDENGAFINAWTTYGPDVFCYTTDAEQYELHVDLQARFREDDQDKTRWYATVVGCFVEDFVGKIPDHGEDGFWVAFTENNTATIHPGTECWPGGAAQVTMPADFSEMRELIVIVTNENRIYYYITTDGGPQLFLQVEITSDQIVCKDAAGTEIWSGQNLINTTDGSHFKFFAHMGTTRLDNVVIKAY